MSLQLVTPPAGEPVSLAEAKLHLRVDSGEDDLLIGSLITAARQAAETITHRQFITARWKLVMDAFAGQAVLIHKSPLLSVVAVEYLDMAGLVQTMPPSHYTVDAACEPARLTPIFGQTWPPTLPQIGAVSVTFDAGYGAASAVPEGIKSWIKLRVGSLYAHREEISVLTRGRIDPLPFVDGLLDGFKVSVI
jgi:uncharacterized phiE125 gp8 family phage protein